MKPSLLLTTVTAPFSATITMGYSLILSWRISAIPPSALPDTIIPFNTAATSYKYSFHFAQQFSTFVNDSTIHKPDDCTHGGPGITCAADFAGTAYANPDNLVILDTEGKRWNGIAVDTLELRERRVRFSSWMLPVGTGDINHFHFGPVQYFPATPTSRGFRYTLALFGKPSKSIGGNGESHNSVQQGNRVDKDIKEVSQEIKIDVGFKPLMLRGFLRSFCFPIVIPFYFPCR
ncbi:hypothetical protein M413DRAFT_280131 [Hebeloma cylindrosporum]|uniref:Uncharacterized protein n=1 Tax=Hebeloma cylindrosporum TaxID=76867 RepID=A0A0C3BY63_HEBCY|nr:hypothetical protein M413DRAFT_280131 [Hebeloma cylindrosporum h7]